MHGHTGVMAKQKKRWSELSPKTRGAIVAAGAVQVALSIAAQVDLTRRPAEKVRGPKICWRAIAMVNVFGPIAYFLRGRVRGAAKAEA